MTDKEKQEMMSEIMQVVNKHVAKSEGKPTQPKTSNRYGREYGISDDEMAKWKEEYKRMRVEGRTILEEVARNPIDISLLNDAPSFNLDIEVGFLK